MKNFKGLIGRIPRGLPGGHSLDTKLNKLMNFLKILTGAKYNTATFIACYAYTIVDSNYKIVDLF